MVNTEVGGNTLHVYCYNISRFKNINQ